MPVFITVILVILALYVFSLRGRSGHPGMEKLRGWSFAHRGLHCDGIPENSLSAFRNALEHGYGVELDVHLLADGNLTVMHDYSLKRTVGADVSVESLTTQQLADYRLLDCGEPIPTLSQVLALFDGKAPLIIELKATTENYAALCRAACEALEGYSGDYCIESFDPRCIVWLKKNRPDIIRGQLAENFFASKSSMLNSFLKFTMTLMLGNFLSRPDFIAYKFSDRKNPGVFLCRKLWQVQGVSWTLKTPQEYDVATKEGCIPIFEGFEP